MKANLMKHLVVATALLCAANGVCANQNFEFRVKNADTKYTGNLFYWFIDGSDYKGTHVTLDAVKEALGSGNTTSLSTYSMANALIGNYSSGSAKTTTSSSGQTLYYSGEARYGTYYYKNFSESGENYVTSSMKLFGLLFDSETVTDSSKYFLMSDLAAPSTGLTNTDLWMIDFNNYSSKLSDSSNWNALGSVPEPTSGVLLLVGVAALALRRKKAA